MLVGKRHRQKNAPRPRSDGGGAAASTGDSCPSGCKSDWRCSSRRHVEDGAAAPPLRPSSAPLRVWEEGGASGEVVSAATCRCGGRSRREESPAAAWMSPRLFAAGTRWEEARRMLGSMTLIPSPRRRRTPRRASARCRGRRTKPARGRAGAGGLSERQPCCGLVCRTENSHALRRWKPRRNAVEQN